LKVSTRCLCGSYFITELHGAREKSNRMRREGECRFSLKKSLWFVSYQPNLVGPVWSGDFIFHLSASCVSCVLQNTSFELYNSNFVKIYNLNYNWYEGLCWPLYHPKKLFILLVLVSLWFIRLFIWSSCSFKLDSVTSTSTLNWLGFPVL